jgi:hypothetical protein
MLMGYLAIKGGYSVKRCWAVPFLLSAPPPPQHYEITCCCARTTTARLGSAGAHFAAAEGRDATLLLVNARAVAILVTSW